MSATALFLRNRPRPPEPVPEPVGVDVRQVSGTALTYGLTAQLDGFSEEFAPGAFTNLASPDILFLRDHDDRSLLARTGAGTLTLTDTAARLEYRAVLPPTEDGNATYELTRRADYGGVSVGFWVEAEEWSRSGRHRLVKRAVLDHLSPVARPAHRTSITARNKHTATGLVEVRWQH